jgi:hypothetical protein
VVDFSACDVAAKATVVTDLWTGKALGTALGTALGRWGAAVPAHGHRLVKIAPPVHEL